jgi:hypothetical protein
MRDYQLISPSLEGILRHGSISYDGLERPDEVLRLMDGPASRGRVDSAKDGNKDTVYTEHQQKIVEQYFHDLYGIFMKKLSYFIVESEPDPEVPLKLQAMLQEMIKVKGLMAKGTEITSDE